MLRGVYSSHDGGRIAYHDGNSATLQEEAMGSRFPSDSLESGTDIPEERCSPCTRAAEGLKGHRMEEVSLVNEILVFSVFSASASSTAWPPVAAVWTMWLGANGSTMVASQVSVRPRVQGTKVTLSTRHTLPIPSTQARWFEYRGDTTAGQCSPHYVVQHGVAG